LSATSATLLDRTAPSIPERETVTVRILTLLVILLPLGGMIAAPFLLWGWGFSWVDLGLLLGMYLLSAVGITVGYHRLLTHRSFETNPTVKFILAVLGSMAVEGSVFKWVGLHRLHHRYSDTHEDPHSPHHHGSGVWGVLRGAWHAHIGWFFLAPPPGRDDCVKDLERSRSLRIASALWPVWILLGLLIPTILGGLIQMSWLGALTGLVWGGLIRIFLVHHVTWSINSACHLWGGREYESPDQSRDNLVFGLLALGEGWHHTHHAFPTSARHGLRWWQIDASYWLIRSMERVGLAWNVRVPSWEAQVRARIK
jgi:stearoyl-CoA desaturase (Delta-9 desaturase)